MKRKLFLHLFVAGFTLGLLNTAPIAAGAETAKSEVGVLIKAYEKALNSGDTSTVMGLYGSNPVFVAPNTQGVAGRDGVKTAYDGLFSAIKPNLTFTIHEVVDLGDTACVRSSSAGEVEILANKAKEKDAYNEMFIVRKEQGQWKIHRYLFNSAMPAAAK